MKASSQNRWSETKKRLEAFDRNGLVQLVGDLYKASAANRRFLESRLLANRTAIEEYRTIIAKAIYPDPFSRRPIGIRDASAAIADYRRATGDVVGTVDLMITFVEAGTEQSVDLGYGDDAYFDALVTKLNAIQKAFGELPAAAQTAAVERLARVRTSGKNIGWGYGDYLDDIVSPKLGFVGDEHLACDAEAARLIDYY